MIQEQGIGLEVLFNTGGITPEDIVRGKEMLDSHGIYPQKVGLQDNVYEAVKAVFPEQKLVYSFNNFPASVADFDAHGHRYAEYVPGRQYIRSEAAMDFIHNQLGGQVVLLVNSGCSHICGGCSTHQHCRSAYQIARRSLTGMAEEGAALDGVLVNDLEMLARLQSETAYPVGAGAELQADGVAFQLRDIDERVTAMD